MWRLLTLILVFCMTRGEWHFQKLSPRNGASFGTSVSMNENFAIIGAPYDDTDITNSGAAYVYAYNVSANEWKYTQTLLSNDPSSYGSFGFSVSIFANNIIVGEYNEDKVHFFRLNETNNNNTFYRVTTESESSSDPQIEYKFGISVDITNGYAIVGKQAGMFYFLGFFLCVGNCKISSSIFTFQKNAVSFLCIH